jgi:signal peptidase I
MEKSSSPDAKKESQFSILVYLIIAVALALGIRSFIAAPWLVVGSSMDPTFQDGNYLIVDRLSYRFEAPQRGDVIVFQEPQALSTDLISALSEFPATRSCFREIW